MVKSTSGSHSTAAKERAKARAKELKARQREITKLHARLDRVAETEMTNDALIDFYLVALKLPRELELALGTLRFMEFYDVTEQDVLEDLLLNGKSSSIYRSLSNAWKRMGQGEEFSWSETCKVTKDVDTYDLLYDVNLGATAMNPYSPEAVAVKLSNEPRNVAVESIWHGLSRRLEWDVEFPQKLASTVDELLDYLGTAGHAAGESREAFLASPLASLLPAMEFVNDASTLEFVRLVHEFNMEWAFAAMDWQRGRSPKLLPALQAFVDSSPWSRY